MVSNKFSFMVFLAVLWRATTAVEDEGSLFFEKDVIGNSAKNCTFAAPKDK